MRQFTEQRPATNCLDRKKGVEMNENDSSVPEYLLPNQNDVLLTPLFTTNNKVNVNIYLVVVVLFS